MPTIKTVFVLEDQVSPALNNIGDAGNTVLSGIENAASAVNAVMNNTAESTSQTAVSLSELSTAGSELASQSRSIADVLEAEAQKAQNSASKYRERADQMASAADYARKYYESLESEMLQTDNLTEAMKENAQVALKEAERLEKAAKAADKKAVKAEKAAESAERMSEAAQKEAQAALEEAESLEKAAEAAEKTAQAEEQLSDTAGMVASEENKAANALDKSEKEAEEYSEAMTKAAGESEKLGEKGTGAITDLKDVIVNAGIVMGLKKIGDAFLECSRSAAEFESGIAKVSTIADTSRVSLSTIEADIMSLSRKTGQSAGDITEASYQAMSASVDTASAVKFVDEANKLAVGGFTQQATAADVLTTAINAYGLQVAEATRLSDMLIMTQNLGKTTVDELAQNMGRVIPLASAYNVEMDNLSAAYAEMTKNGIATAESTTYIKSMLNELGSSGSEVSKVLTEQTGQSFAQLMQNGYSLGDVLQVLGQSVDGNTTAFNNLWGSQEAGIGALSLFNSGAAAFNGTLREMQGSAGATEKAYSAMTDTTEFAAQRMSNSFSNLKLTIGGQLNPVMEELYNRVADTIDSFTTFAEENPEVVAGISSLVTGISMATVVATGFNGIIKVVIPSLKALGVAAKANPVIAIVSGVTALATAVSTFKKVMDGNEEKVEAYNGTLEQCRTELEATETAYENVSRMYGENSSAASNLAEKLSTLNAQYEQGGGRLAEIEEKANAAASKMDELNQAVQSQYNELDTMQLNGFQAIAMLESLSSKSEITNTDLDLMSKHADYLNDTFNCNIVVDYDTGEITGINPKAISDMIMDTYQEKKIKISMDELSNQEFVDSYASSFAALAAAQKEYDNALTLYGEKADELHQKYLDAVENNDGETTQEMKRAWKAYHKFGEKIEKPKLALDEAQKKFDEADSKAKMHCMTIDETGETYRLFTDSIKESSGAVGIFSENADELNQILTSEQIVSDIWGSKKDEIRELAEEYEEAFNATRSSMDNMFGLFEKAEMDLSEAFSLEGAMDNIESQLEYFEQYETAVAELSQLGFDNNVLSSLDPEQAVKFYQELNEMDTEAAKGKVDEINEKMGKLSEVKDKASETMLGLNEELTQKFSDMQKDMETAVDEMITDMDRNSEAGEAAKKTMEGYIKQLKSNGDSAVLEAENIGARIASALSSSSKITPLASGAVSLINQSSKIFGPQPYDIKRGYATGTLSAEPGVALVGEEGPELVMFRGGETVYTADETERIIKGNSDRPLYVPPGESGTAQSDNQPGAVPCRKIELEINGKGKIEMKSGTDKNEVVKIMQENLKPVLYEIVSEEFFEEGDYAYEY